MLERLMPRSDQFFDDFDKQAAATVEGCRLLKELLENFTDVSAKAQAIKGVENQGDEHTHTAYERLHKQFITPFDRSEIHRLLSRIDDVLDLAEAAAERLKIYEVREVPQDAKELGGILYLSALKMREAVGALREIKRPSAILEACKEINRLENEADSFLRAGLVQLFKNGGDPLEIMKWKEILELLEAATDRCEDVADIIEGVVLEHS